jgi:hypothetical protein
MARGEYCGVFVVAGVVLSANQRAKERRHGRIGLEQRKQSRGRDDDIHTTRDDRKRMQKLREALHNGRCHVVGFACENRDVKHAKVMA